MKHRILTIAILLLVICKTTYGQSIVWGVPLQDCTSLEEIARNMYKVVKDGKIGVIDSRGNIIVPIENSEITGFHDGVALLLSGNKINGLLNSDGKYNQFNEDYFALDGQKFYSDEYVTVENSKKEKGFVDFNGNPLGFDKRYTKIKPFTEGYAAVFKGNQYSLIDKNLIPIPIKIGVGTITGGTNMYNGKAIVWDEKGRAYEVGRNFSLSPKKEFDNNKLKKRGFDYLHRLMCVTNQSDFVKWDKIDKGDIMMSPYKNNAGKYGYENIIPCQFDDAEPFRNNLAIVRGGNQWGILKLIPDDALFEVQSKEKYTYKEGEEVECSLRFVSLPREWQNRKLLYSIKEAGTNKVVADDTILNREISFNLIPKAEKETFNVLVYSDNLQLWSGDITCIFKKLMYLQAEIEVRNTKADANDKCHVRILLKNPNDESKEVNIKIDGSKSLDSKNQQVKLKANETLEIQTCFNVPKVKLSNQKLQVKEDGKLIKEEIVSSLTPFYTGE